MDIFGEAVLTDGVVYVTNGGFTSDILSVQNDFTLQTRVKVEGSLVITLGTISLTVEETLSVSGVYIPEMDLRGKYHYLEISRNGIMLEVYVDGRLEAFARTDIDLDASIIKVEGLEFEITHLFVTPTYVKGQSVFPKPVDTDFEPYQQYRMESNSPFCEVSGHAMKITGSSKIVDGKFYSSQPRTLELPSFLVEENEDFTIELKFNVSSLPTNFSLLGQWNIGNSNNNSWTIGGGSTSFYMATADSSGLSVGAGPGMPRSELKLNTDYHVAVTRENGTMRMFLDGKLKSTVYLPTAFYKSTIPLRNGFNDPTSFVGYLWDIRMVKGKSMYSDDFTPYALPAYKAPKQLQASNICQQVSLRKHNSLTDLGDVIDVIGGIPAYHQVSFGRIRTLSPRMDAATFKIPCRYFGAGDFTIETNFRINRIAAAPYGYAAVIARHNRLELNTGENRWLISAASPDYPYISFTAYTDTPVNAGDVVGKFGFGYTLRSNGGSAQIGVDYHIAIVRKSGKVYMFLDGVQQDMVLDFNLPLRGQGDTPEENYFTGTYGDITGTTELYSIKEVWNIRISDKAQYEIGKNFKPLNRLPTVFPSLDGVTDLDAAFAIDETSIKGDLIEYVSTVGGEKFLNKVPKGTLVESTEGGPLGRPLLATTGLTPDFDIPFSLTGSSKWTMEVFSKIPVGTQEHYIQSFNHVNDRFLFSSYLTYCGVWNNTSNPRLQAPTMPQVAGRVRHIAMTYDAGVISIYVNGFLIRTGNWTLLEWSIKTFNFGHQDGGSYLFDGYRIREGIHFTDNFNIHTIYPEGRRSVTHDGFEMDLLGQDTKVTERGIEIYNGAVEIKDVPYFGAEDFHISVDFTSLEDSASVSNYVFGQYFNGTLVDERNSWNLRVRIDSNRVLQWVERRGNSTVATSGTLSAERFSLQNNVKYKIEVIKTSEVVSLYVDGTFYSSVVSPLPLVEVGLPIYTEQYEDVARYGSCSKILNNLKITSSEYVRTRLRVLGPEQGDGIRTVQSITTEGVVVSTFQAYCDVTTPRGPFVLTLDWKNVTESILAKDVMDLEFNAVTVTDDPERFPVVPSGTLINTYTILFKSEHPSWVSTQGPWTIVDCGLINGSIPSSGQHAWNELKGDHFLFGRDAGWGTNKADVEFGFMTTWGNQGICGGVNRVGIPACPIAFPNPSNLHFDSVYRKQVYVKAEF